MTPSKSFYLNNSAFPILACAQQYVYRCVTGLKPPPGGNKYLATGIAFHKMMQIVGTEACPNIQLALLFGDKSKLHPSITAIPEATQLQLAALAQRIYTEHPNLFNNSKRELHFEYSYPEDPSSTIRTGTIDLLTYDESSDTVILTDYKTTAKPIDGALITNYNLSSQRFYYLLAAYYFTDLPPAWQSAIANHRLAWRYCFVAYEKDQYHLAEPALVDLPELETFARLFNEKAQYAAALHDDPSLAVKEGILSGQCWKCPYTALCTTAEPNLDAWPYGRAEYNPKHQDE